MTAWLHPLGFALSGSVALLLGVLGMRRKRGGWPVPTRAKAGAGNFDTPQCGPPSVWHAGVVRSLDSPSFTALCEAMFTQDGLVTGPIPRNSAGPADFADFADFVLHRQGNAAHHRLIRCHGSGNAPIGAAAVQAFARALAAASAEGGLFIAAGNVETAAVACARDHAITLVDGPALIKLIVQRSPRQQQALRDLSRALGRARAPRLALTPTPAPAWFAVAAAGFLATWMAWPAPRWVAPPEAAATPAPTQLAAAQEAVPQPDAARSHRPRAAPATIADLDPPAPNPAPPAAGRQVLRCDEAGRITYRAIAASCAPGHGERITVFPTEGVHPFR